MVAIPLPYGSASGFPAQESARRLIRISFDYCR
jgi:hypothetical protein